MVCEIGSEAAKYLCVPPEKPLSGHIYAPFFELSLKGMLFKCGNESYDKDPHKVALKSMQYGLAQGQGGTNLEFELIAEGATGYKELLDVINKSIAEAPEDIKDCWFKFGWIRKVCGSGSTLIGPQSPEIPILPTKLSTNIDSGVTKIKLTCTDLLIRSFSRRVEKNEGAEDDLIPLKQAIKQLCQNNDPVIDVEFRDKDGGELEFELSEDKEGKGPKSGWQANELPLLSTIRNWVNVVKTQKGLGVYFKYDPENVKLIIQEDDACNGKDENCGCNNIRASYIVNGGNCSNVLSFSPDIEWVLDAGGHGGGSGGSSSGNMIKAKPPSDSEKIEPSGSGNTISIPAEANTIPPEVRAANAAEANAAHTMANKPLELKKTIEAELTIIGDPSWHTLAGIAGRYVSIAVVSPFAITGGSGECVWLAKPPLNPVLSNKMWMIQGADHQIEAGKFVTKLKVTLPAGNAELPAGSELGNNDSGYNPDGQGDGFFTGQSFL